MFVCKIFYAKVTNTHCCNLRDFCFPWNARKLILKQNISAFVNFKHNFDSYLMHSPPNEKIKGAVSKTKTAKIIAKIQTKFVSHYDSSSAQNDRACLH